MFKTINLPKGLLAAALSASLLLAIPAPAAFAATQQVVTSVTSVPAVSSEEYALFLQNKYDLVVTDSLTRGEFLQAIAKVLRYEPDSKKAVTFDDLTSASPYYTSAAALYQKGIITSSTVAADQSLSALQAVFIAVKAADLKELAYSYPEEKVNRSLASLALEVKDFSSLKAAQEVAAAKDAGLVDPAFYSSLKPGVKASKDFVEQLLGQVLTVKGQYKHYIGYTSDADIYAKLNDAYTKSDIIEAPELANVVNTALEQGLVTGYNLKDARFDSNFVNSLALTYGHSNLKHAIQLVGLLRSENIEAKVQFEPKTSAFIHLIEWGQPSPSSLNHYKKLDNGNYISSAKEYDIAFEFNNAADKDRFQTVVLKYAKKNSDDTTGLIASSWWQPLYYSLTDIKDYDVITNNKITGKGNYYAQSFSLNDKSEAIVEGFKKIDSSVEVSTYKFWVDRPFYNYLTGDDFK